MYKKDHIVARMAGDEFLFYIKNACEAKDVVPIVDGIMDFFTVRCEKDEILSNTSLSIGISLTTQEGKNYKQLFRCADN